MNDDLEQLIARLQPKGVEAELRPRILAAVENQLQAEQPSHRSWLGVKRIFANAATEFRASAPRSHPAGHQFVCVHCGSEAQRASGAHRWGRPAALAALASAAAVLLIVFLANRPTEIAERKIERSPNGPAVAQGEKALAIMPDGESPGPIKATTTSEPTLASDADRGKIEGLARWQRNPSSRLDTHGILSASDTELRDDPSPHGDPSISRNAVSVFDIESTDAQLRYGAILHCILRESGVSGGGLDQSIMQPLNSTRSKL